MSISPANQGSSAAATPFKRTYFHGTKANLQPGELLMPGFQSNYKDSEQLNHIYFTGTLDAAIWGAELANGDGKGRIYIVEPTGDIEDDPNLTDKKFPGNPSQSYRSLQAIKILGEVINWQGHSEGQLRAMKEGLAKLRELGLDEIDN
jgi:hypothetical protein